MAGTVTTTKTASWGVTSGFSGVVGVVTDFERSCESTLAPEQNEMGSVINQTQYDIHTIISATIQVASSTALPRAGGAITVDGDTYYVTSARVVENNTAYRKIVVMAESYKLCTATENAQGIATGN